MARNSAEYLSIIKTTSKLTRAVKNDLVWLSGELVSKQLVTADQGEELRNGKIDGVERAASLVKLITDKVEQDKKNFLTFIRILMDNRSAYEDVLECLESVYTRAGGHVYNQGAPAPLLIAQPWYHKELSREDAEKMLEKMDIDSFLVRNSTTSGTGKFNLVLSVKNREKPFYHFPIERGVGSYQIQGTNEPFSSVVELIDYYKQRGILESDSKEVVSLNSPCLCGASPLSMQGHSLYYYDSPSKYLQIPYSDSAYSKDSLSLTRLAGGFKSHPLRNSYSTGNLLELTEIPFSSPEQKGPHKTHATILVSDVGERPRLVESESRQSTLAQCATADEVSAFPPKEPQTCPRTNSTGGVAGTNKPLKLQTEHESHNSRWLSHSVPPEQDISDSSSLPRSSPQVRANDYSIQKWRARRLNNMRLQISTSVST